MTEPRIVTPQEAQRELAWIDPEPWAERQCLNLAHTVATEPGRIAAAERAAVVKALRQITEHELPSRRAIREYTNDIENGIEDL